MMDAKILLLKALSFLVFLVLMSACTSTGGKYTITMERDFNLIILFCRNHLTPVSATFLRKTSTGSTVLERNATEFPFNMQPALEGYYSCAHPLAQSTESESIRLLAYPVRRVDTKDFYLLPVGTKSTSVDGGITPGVLSEYYNEFYWNIGNDVIMPGNQRPRIAVHRQNFSMTILNSELSDGETYICYVNVQTYTAEQMITILSHTPAHITPTGNTTVAVEDGEQEYIMYTCSLEAQTGADTLKSVSVRWLHNEKSTDGEKYTVHNESVLSPTEGYLRAESMLKIDNLEMADSGDVECYITTTLITAQEGREEVVRLRSTASLLVITNELHLEVEQVLGGHIELCIKNLPIPLQKVDQAKLKVKLTSVDETSPRAKSATHVELITPYGGLKVVNSNTVCYSLSENEIAWRLPSQYIKVQVALRIDDTAGPYVPSISNATVIEIKVPTNPTSTSSSFHNKQTLAIAAVLVALVLQY